MWKKTIRHCGTYISLSAWPTINPAVDGDLSSNKYTFLCKTAELKETGEMPHRKVNMA